MHEDFKRAIEKKINANISNTENQYRAVNRLLASYISDTLMPAYASWTGRSGLTEQNTAVTDVVNILDNRAGIQESLCMPKAIGEIIAAASEITQVQLYDDQPFARSKDADNARTSIETYTLLITEAYQYANRKIMT